MIHLAVSFIISALAIYLTALILPGINIPDLYHALLVAIIFFIINTFVKPILKILTFPITLLTFGLFSIILNIGLILIVSRIIPEFQIDGIFWAFVFSIVYSLINTVLSKISP